MNYAYTLDFYCTINKWITFYSIQSFFLFLERNVKHLSTQKFDVHLASKNLQYGL